jgi:hypothetical protein
MKHIGTDGCYNMKNSGADLNKVHLLNTNRLDKKWERFGLYYQASDNTVSIIVIKLKCYMTISDGIFIAQNK